jgi:sulfur carrier protein ThiS
LGFKVIQLSVNGQVRRLEPGANVTRLLEALELAGKRVAV